MTEKIKLEEATKFLKNKEQDEKLFIWNNPASTEFIASVQSVLTKGDLSLEEKQLKIEKLFLEFDFDKQKNVFCMNPFWKGRFKKHINLDSMLNDVKVREALHEMNNDLNAGTFFYLNFKHFFYEKDLFYYMLHYLIVVKPNKQKFESPTGSKLESTYINSLSKHFIYNFRIFL